MRDTQSKSVRSALAIAALAIAVLAWATVARGHTPVKIPLPISLHLETRFAPKAVPTTERAPIALHFWGEISDPENTHPRPLRELALEFDRSIAIDVKGLPTCLLRRRSHDSEQIRRICKDAIVGEGEVVVEYAYPENAWIDAHSDLIIFNGGHRNGETTLYAHSFITIPTPKATVMPLKIHKVHNGRYGSKGVLEIPELGDGYGSLISFDFGLNRKFRRHGESVGVVSLRCPDKELQINARGTFEDDTVAGSTSLNPCTPKPTTRQ